MSHQNKTIIITGTHITPAIELINQLKNDPVSKWNIHYIGRQYTSPIERIPAVEYELIPKLNVNYHIIDCGKLDRRYWPNTIQGLPKTIKGIFQAINYINKIKPDIVVSFGGYLSVPVIVASSFFGIKSITHEQTLTNSLSTRINSHFATKVALSFDNDNQKQQLPHDKIAITGNLLRSELQTSDSQLFNKLIPHPSKPIIYITAGNQGSQKINSNILKLLPSLTRDFIVIHQTGKFDYDRIKSQNIKDDDYFFFDYIKPEDIGWIFHHSEIFISRAGANICQEIATFQKKVILIPLPVTQQNEQLRNASWLQQQLPDTTIILHDQELTENKLLDATQKLKSITSKKSKSVFNPNLKLLQLIHEIN